jgi:hypothetical protein
VTWSLLSILLHTELLIKSWRGKHAPALTATISLSNGRRTRSRYTLTVRLP